MYAFLSRTMLVLIDKRNKLQIFCIISINIRILSAKYEKQRVQFKKYYKEIVKIINLMEYIFCRYLYYYSCNQC